MPKADAGNENTLKRERAGTYRTKDGRFTVEQSSSGWVLLDDEQTNELGLPLARGPFATLDAAKEAIPAARSGPAPSSEVEPRRASTEAGDRRTAGDPEGHPARTETRGPRRPGHSRDSRGRR